MKGTAGDLPTEAGGELEQAGVNSFSRVGSRSTRDHITRWASSS